MDYQQFLASKAPIAKLRGFEPRDTASHLFPFQRHCVEHNIRCGSAGLFLDTGLGKTACQLEWARQSAEYGGGRSGRALILTPLAVARQIESEGKKFGYDCAVIREQEDVKAQISVCNYDRLSKLDLQSFDVVALDESSILKSFNGKTTAALIQGFAGHRYRLSATATPAPNDHMELGQHSQFLGIMPSNEMLMRWFIADQTEMGRYRLKHHGVGSFWRWMASWSRMGQKPSDFGFTDEGYELQPIRIETVRTVNAKPVDGGDLFGIDQISATDIHRIKRQTTDARAAAVADIVRSDLSEPWVVWCDTDYEADAINKALKGIEGVAEVRGSHPAQRKEDTITGFADGSVRVLITKPSVCGFGLNWQHCARTVYVGRSFSYEAWYQSIRRFWRFGQKREVICWLILAEGEDAIARTIDRKAADHGSMKAQMAKAMRENINAESSDRVAYNPTHKGELPSWLKSVV